MKMTFSSNFDGSEFKKKMYAAAEKAFKDKVQKSLAGIKDVKISYSGSFENGDLTANLSGPEDQVAIAKKLLQAEKD